MEVWHYINNKLIKKYQNIDYKYDDLEKKYEFFLDNIQNYIYITDRLIFIRENDDYIFNLEIGVSNKADLKLKEHNKVFDLPISNAKYDVKDKVINIYYHIDIENESHHIIMKVDD